MSPTEFLKLWVADGDRLICCDPDRAKMLQIPEDSKSFLISTGLPREAAPFLTFLAVKNQMLQTVSEIWHQPDEFRRYRIIGEDAFGDPICVDEKENGRVVYLNHDHEFLVGFINSSIPQLAYSALAFREAVKQRQAIQGQDACPAKNFPDSVVDEFIIKMDVIDPQAIKDGTFWFRSILGEGI